MRCYIVQAKDGTGLLATRIAATNALAREARDELVAELSLRKKDVSIEQHEVPVAKAELIEYLNGVYAKSDGISNAEEEDAE